MSWTPTHKVQRDGAGWLVGSLVMSKEPTSIMPITIDETGWPQVLLRREFDEFLTPLTVHEKAIWRRGQQ